MSSIDDNEVINAPKQCVASGTSGHSERHARRPSAPHRKRTYEVPGDTGEDIIGPFITGTDMKGKHLMEYAIKCPYTKFDVHHSNGTISTIKRGKGFNANSTGLGGKVPFVGRKRIIKKQEKLYTAPVDGPTDITVEPIRGRRGSASSEDSNASYYSTNKKSDVRTITRTLGATPDFQHQQMIDMSYVAQPQIIHHRNGKTEEIEHTKLLNATLRKGPQAPFAFRHRQATRPVLGPLRAVVRGVAKISNR